MKTSYLIPTIFILLIWIITPAISSARSTIDKSKLTLIDPTRPDFVNSKKGSTSSKSKKTKKMRKSISRLSLQQTFISQFKKIAIINGAALTVGEVIRGAKLVSIKSNYVELQHMGKLVKLRLTLPTDIQEVSGN